MDVNPPKPVRGGVVLVPVVSGPISANPVWGPDALLGIAN